ncbi:MAG: TIGR01777 family oxidoreductase [Oligoflexia bacterium]
MKILLTGGTGMVGSELGLELVKNGHTLRLLTRDPARHHGKLPFPAELVEWDALQGPPRPEAFKGIDAVIHLAGEGIASGRWNAARKKAIFDSRITGTRNLVAGIRTAIQGGEKISVLLAASAVGIYGDRGNEELTEASAVDSKSESKGAVGFLSSICRQWEQAARDGLPTSVRSVQLRIGVVLGLDGGALGEMLPLFRKGVGGRLSSGKQWMSWIHIEDLARLFQFALTRSELSGPVNATGPVPVTNSEFTQSLSQAVGKPAIFPAPASALKVAVGAMAQAVLSSQKVLPSHALKAGFEFKYPTLNAALANLIPEEKDNRIRVRQWIDASLDQVFAFFSDARNLERITPSFLNFQITQMSTPEVGQGTLIDYRLKVRGVPVRWRTLIEEWKPQSEFVDTQLKGPYRKWHHTHRFWPLADGVLIEDDVLYRVPMGWLGQLVAGGLVSRDVKKIFDYRREVIAGIFSDSTKSRESLGGRR